MIARSPRVAIAVVLAALALFSWTSCAAPARDTARLRDQDEAWVGGASTGNEAPARATAIPPVSLVPLSTCSDHEEGFEGWLLAFRKHAEAQGISPKTLDASLAGLSYDPEVVDLDRSQRGLKRPFKEFAAAHVTSKRVARGKELLREMADLFTRIEAKFGVPGEILVAIWGLETEFGAATGQRSCLRSLATLAYDCRRSARFRGELLSALRIVDRGDLPPYAMVGAWAGELGQTQFLPSSYERYAVDFDGDGHADLIGSSPDALASTASYLAGHGWKAKEPYGEGSTNAAALASWNASETYTKTLALFATKLARR